MTTYRVKKDRNFTTVLNLFIDSPHLSAKAKGILLYLLSKPDDWKVYEKDIVANMKDGRDSIRTGLKELTMHGYIQRKRLHGSDGKFKGYEYEVREAPAGPRSAIVVRSIGDKPTAIQEQQFKQGHCFNFNDFDAIKPDPPIFNSKEG